MNNEMIQEIQNIIEDVLSKSPEESQKCYEKYKNEPFVIEFANFIDALKQSENITPDYKPVNCDIYLIKSLFRKNQKKNNETYSCNILDFYDVSSAKGDIWTEKIVTAA